MDAPRPATPPASADAPVHSRSVQGYLFPGLATLSLGLGFADLVRGGVTAGPLLLVLGYVVLVPLAIRRGGR